ncbi:MAG TPA: M15 family metallopeptidase [bacterium]|nr:M15 family metallopeptidase [bacterium]
MVKNKSGSSSSGYTTFKNRWGKQIYLSNDLYSLWLSFQQAAADAGIEIEVTEGWRGQAAQEYDYQDHTSNAHFGQSAHNFAAAFDVVPIVDNKPDYNVSDSTWEQLGTIGQDQGLKWGGTFSTGVFSNTGGDKPHFELPNWKTYALLDTAPDAVEV